jgi:chemotaxis protein CheD
MAGSPTIAAVFAQRLVIGVGELIVSDNPALTLSTYALGSCVGVVAYDAVARAGGLLHLMLPNSAIAPDRARNQPAMFADTGLPLLFESLHGLRARRERLVLFIAGGANVLGAVNDSFRIGERNLEWTEGYLRHGGYAPRFRATSGTVNRTVHLELGTGLVRLKTGYSNETYSLA